MYKKNIGRFILAGACSFVLGIAQGAGDPEAGKYKFSTCLGCHGIPGYTNVYPAYHVPRLGGQHAQYIVAALKEYQAGNRKHPTMHANAFPLSDQDMEDIAAYVSQASVLDKSHPITGDVAAGKKKAAACAACHGPEGNGPDPNFPRLAGQHEDYLYKALRDYKSGERKNAIMNGMAAPLSNSDMLDLAAYFASQAKGLGVVKQ
jgi:cytochrome c553